MSSRFILRKKKGRRRVRFWLEILPSWIAADGGVLNGRAVEAVCNFSAVICRRRFAVSLCLSSRAI
jgi:hypothetical protein